MSLFNMRIGGGGGGASASIFAYGDQLQSTDTVYSGKKVLNPAWHGLPAEYQEVEYLESTGVQWTETDFILNQDCKIEFKATRIRGSFLFGARSVRDKNSFLIGLVNVSSGQISFYFDGATRVTGPTADGNKTYEVEASKEGFYINGSLIGVPGKANEFTLTYPLVLFGAHDQSSSIGKNVCRLFYERVYDNGTLSMNFIPCYRISDSKPGMYDMVNDVFYVNQGTGTDFLVGNDVPQYVANPATRINGVWQTRQKPNPAWHGLPADYQEVEYLESTGVQVLNTGLTSIEISKVVSSVLFDYPAIERQVVAGVYQETHRQVAYYFCIRADTDGTIYIRNDNGWISSGIKAEPNRWYEFETTIADNLTKLIVDGSTVIETVGNKSTDGTWKVYLFALNSRTGYPVTQYLNGKMKKVLIYNNDNNLVRNFIPCRRISDSKPGMYDTVNGVFYANQGTGADFLVGDDVPQYLTEQGFEIAPIREYGTWQLVASNGTTTKTIDVLIDAAEEFKIEVDYGGAA